MRLLRDAAVVLAVVVAVGLWQSRHLLGDDQPAPRARVQTPGGETATVGEGSGKPTLLYFFAPWCGVCKVSMSNAQTVGRWLGEDHVDIVAVGLDFESAAEVAAFVGEHAPGIRYYLGDSAVRDAYKVAAYPTYYVLDARGRIVHASVGYSILPGILALWGQSLTGGS